ncbi:hypothetical protein [Chitinophaga sancti]|uniref:LTXXQ motif family protein n=1 Tax=Chitinophaga sancti TaxID=1004 RepID=A0A1K1SZX3_9BACT|nr:hypothetical protein [Chitinophaga sancti]WQD63644.1 hypothetical protein U0033_04495 [Chitinophaga sancti]WQG90731.1 hypothetical protein SR876_04425 [Chitinophaga sancti]SFW89631.1 hypothetical protein SAMN05661012_06462 [Chitinophaga sancti]
MRNKIGLVALFVLFLGMCQGAFAQDGSRKDQATKAITDTMQVHLSLNDDQYKKVYDINAQFLTKLGSIKQDGGGKLAKFQKLKSADQERDAALKPVLSDDQFKKYQEFKKARREEMRENYKNSKS